MSPSNSELRQAASETDMQDEEILSDDGSEGSTPSNGEEEGMLPPVQQTKSAYYDYASEKLMSNAESKMLYQRHHMENMQNDGEPHSPISRARTFSYATGKDAGYGGLSRSVSNASHTSARSYSLRQKGRTPVTSAPSENLDEPGIGGGPSQDDTRPDGHPYQAQEQNQQDFVSDPNEGVGYALSGSEVAPELRDICTKIKKVLDTRRRYLELSLQRAEDDPRHKPSWDIYPPPPLPAWVEENNPPLPPPSGTNSLENSKTDSLNEPPSSQGKKRRKAGCDIGEDFDMNELLPLPGEDDSIVFKLDQASVYQVYGSPKSMESDQPIAKVPTLRRYYKDLVSLEDWAADGPSKSYAYRQLDILDGKYNLYKLEHDYQETVDCKTVPHRDFYNVRKVDTHVHHSSCMNQKHLLRYIKSKMKKSPDDIVMYRDGNTLTLKEVFESINLTAYDLSIDTLDMHAHTDSFHRFDKFNLKYNPMGESRLREIFLKTDNYTKGKFLAEVTREVISDLESSKYQFVEWRVSIYGKSLDEWDKLARWVVHNKLFSHNVRWLVQIPRLYLPWKRNETIDNFEQLIVNIFQPLFEVTHNPSKHPELHVFLQRVIGFDTVDDESKQERRLYRKYPTARGWDTLQNPPYTYWIYYLFANMASLNVWRKRRGFSTFVLRPHCGEAGDPDHLAAAVLCCHSISHGITLRKVPCYQYIFYLDQIGIAMSPLSNNALFLTYERNPFPRYFNRGLNVSLSTDDPLQFAFTKEPLIEEYSVAAQIYKLSAVDMCELAENSVLQSGFEHALKKHWLGEACHLPGVLGNRVAKSNVPDVRKRFRQDTLDFERSVYVMTSIIYSSSDVDFLHLHVGNVSWRCCRNRTDVTYSIERYAAPTETAKIPSRTASLRLPAPQSLNAAPRIPKSQSNIDMTPMDGSYATQNLKTPTRSSSMIWSDAANTAPKMFPGLVHERTRRNSVRQNNGPERDGDGIALGRPRTKDGHEETVPEE